MPEDGHRERRKHGKEEEDVKKDEVRQKQSKWKFSERPGSASRSGQRSPRKPEEDDHRTSAKSQEHQRSGDKRSSEAKDRAERERKHQKDEGDEQHDKHQAPDRYRKHRKEDDVRQDRVQAPDRERRHRKEEDDVKKDKVQSPVRESKQGKEEDDVRKDKSRSPGAWRERNQEKEEEDVKKDKSRSPGPDSKEGKGDDVKKDKVQVSDRERRHRKEEDDVKKDKVQSSVRESKQGKEEDDVRKDKSRSPGAWRERKQEKEEEDVKKDKSRSPGPDSKRGKEEDVKTDKVQAPDRYRKQGKEEDDVRKDKSRSPGAWRERKQEKEEEDVKKDKSRSPGPDSKEGKGDDVKKDKIQAPDRERRHRKEEEEVKEDNVRTSANKSQERQSSGDQRTREGRTERERKHRKEDDDVKKDKVQSPVRESKQGKEEDDVRKDKSRSPGAWRERKQEKEEEDVKKDKSRSPGPDSKQRKEDDVKRDKVQASDRERRHRKEEEDVKKDKVQSPVRESKQGKEEDDVRKNKSRSPGAWRERKEGKEEEDVKKHKSRSPGPDSKQGKEHDVKKDKDQAPDRERRHRKEEEDVKKDKVQSPVRESKQGKEEDDVKNDKSRSPGRDSKQGKEEDDVKKDRERRHRKEGEDVKKDKVQAPDRYRKQGKEEDDVKKDESRQKHSKWTFSDRSGSKDRLDASKPSPSGSPRSPKKPEEDVQRTSATKSPERQGRSGDPKTSSENHGVERQPSKWDFSERARSGDSRSPSSQRTLTKKSPEREGDKPSSEAKNRVERESKKHQKEEDDAKKDEARPKQSKWNFSDGARSTSNDRIGGSLSPSSQREKGEVKDEVRQMQSKWNFSERARSTSNDRAGGSGSRSSSQRRSTLLDASVPEKVRAHGSETSSTPSRRPSFDLAQYFQAKRDSNAGSAGTALPSTVPARSETPVPHFGMAETQESDKAEEPKEADTAVARGALEQLEAELETLRLTDLKNLAEAYKCPAKEVDRAYDQEDPNVAMKDLIMAKATRAAQRLAALKPSELRRRAEALGLGPRRVAQAEDQPDPKVAFVKLLLRTGPAPTSDVSKALSPLPQTPPEYGESSPKFSHMSMSPEVHQVHQVGDAAATRIQANVRGSATRRRLAQEAEAASTIQRNVRQHQSKRRSIDIERDEAKVAAAKRSTKLLKEEQKVLQQLKADMAILKARDLRRLAEDWGCESSQLLRAEEDEQPKVAVRRLVLDRARVVTAQLQELPVPELKQRAKAAGCSDEEVEQAEDGEEPKVALFRLICSDLLKLQQTVSARETSAALQVPELAHAFMDLKAALEKQRPKQLAKVLRSTGCRPAELQEVEDDEKPKERMKQMILDLAREVLNEFHGMKMSELKNFAVGNGVSSVEIEDCADAEMPKVALTKLLLSRMPFHPSQFSSTPRNPRAGGEIFSFNMDLNDSVDTPEIDKMSEIDKAFVRMKVELEKMKVTELKQRALIYGCTDETIDDALDQENPKVALGQLILEVARDARDALLEMRFTELKQHAYDMGISQETIEAAEDAEQPKEQLILAIFASKNEEPMSSTLGEGWVGTSEEPPAAEAYRAQQRAHRSATTSASPMLAMPRQDLEVSPGPHRLGPGAFGLAWWYLKAEEDESEDDPDSRRGRGPPHEVAPQVVSPAATATALPVGQRPLPSSHRSPPEISFEDAGRMPQHLWPWIALHAPLKPPQRRKLAAKTLRADTEEQKEVQLSEALQMVHWCWAHQHPSTAASSLVPMLFLGNESSAVLHWALMLLATQLWRKATCAERKEYLVDNRQLKAKTTGLSYFFSRRFDDVDPGKTALWGQVVLGRKSRGKWVKVGHCCYLPTELDGIQVLRDDFGPEDLAQQPSSPRALGYRYDQLPSLPIAGPVEASHGSEGEVFNASDLAKDLKKALKTSVEKRQELDDAIDQCEQALAEKRHVMTLSIEDTQLELAAAQERATLEAGLLNSSSRALLGDRNVSQEYAKTTAARDAARHRARWLREELQSVEASRGPGPSTAASKVVEQGPLRALQKEVQRFRKELDRLESKEQQRRLDPREEDEIDEARREAQQTAEELTARSLRLKQSEAALERQRAEVRAKAEEASLKKLEASTQKAKCQRIQGEIIELQGEERTTLGRAQQLEREAASLAKAYERYKETCFVYGAAIPRSSGPTSKLGNQDLERRPVRRGVDALIETLASRFGWPEVAFLRLDRRGSGRLGAQELRMGLLIGAAVDFPAITGLTAEALFSAIDWRSAGFITAADLAACRPDIWREFGAAALEVDEKVRALPWLALGGPRKAFQDATAHQNSSLKWSDFEMVLCERLHGLPKQEVQELFAKIAEKDLSDALVVSPASWEKITKEPAFRSGFSSDAPSLAH